MTTPDTEKRTQSSQNTLEKKVPTIEGEEDIPFPATGLPSTPLSKRPVDEKLHETDDIDKEITRFRFLTGRMVLYIAMGAMAAMVILDLFASHWLGEERDMIENAFEAFKLITVTILGYIFGSSGINGSNTAK